MRYLLHGISLLLLLFILSTALSFAQGLPPKVSYLSPRPGACMVSTGNNIIVKLTPEERQAGSFVSAIYLENGWGHPLEGTLKNPAEGTFLFQPHEKFGKDQDITVTFDVRSASRPDRGVERFTYTFRTASREPEDWPPEVMDKIRNLYQPSLGIPGPVDRQPDSQVAGAVNDSLPPFYPDITITHWADPSPTYTFVQPLNYPDWTFYAIILDNYGTPVFYRSVPLGGMDFKLQPNGLMTYWDASVGNGKFFVLDDRGNMLDTIGMGNGYTTDLHELRMEEDGEFWTLGYDPQIVRMDTIVPGGRPDATVIGLIVQKLDTAGSVVFQWRSWDHFLITDASDWVILTDSIIDYVHGNSIALESDTSILISSRNMNEITKIDTRTGDMVWRLQGKNNQFTYLGSEQGFSVQHSIRKMNNGHYSIFDNGSGNTPLPHYSSAVEYIIDEEAMTATEVQRIRRTPDIYAPFMGHAQRMDNGNTVCGWGPTTPNVTEFDPDGNMLLEFSFPHANYRGFKFHWQTSLFDVSHDTLDFGNIWPLGADSAEVVLTNPDPEPLEIHRIIHHGGIFDFDLQAPFTIPANGEVRFNIHFTPDTLGQWYDVLTFAHEVHEEDFHLRLARQVFIKGENNDGSFIPGYEPPEDEEFVVFPNPNHGDFLLGTRNADMRDIFIYDANGSLVKELRNISADKVLLSLEHPAAGIYLVRVSNQVTNREYFKKVVVH